MNPEHAARLHGLIASLFTAPELRSWVWLQEAARPIYETLPGEAASKDELVQALIVGLTQQGLINDALLGALVAARPKGEADVAAFAALLGRSPPSPGPGTAPIKALSRTDQVIALEELLRARDRPPRDKRLPVDLGARIDALVAGLRAAGQLHAGMFVANAQLIKVVGRGDFGTSWLARESSGREVVVKLFHLEKLAEGGMLSRFRRGVQTMRRLTAEPERPASLAPILAVSPDGLGFTTPYCPEGDLDAIGQHGWSTQVKLDYFLEICRGVDFAHQREIVHGNIKPTNVLFDAHRRPVLTDFGLYGVTPTPSRFAAPEALSEGGRADERSDVYSLGRLLHFMLLERPPGRAIEPDPTLDDLRDFAPAVVSLVRGACQLDPARRTPNVQTLIQTLERQQTGWAAVHSQTGRVSRWARRNVALTLLLSLLGVGVLVGSWMVERAAAREAAQNERLMEERAQQIQTLRQRKRELQSQQAKQNAKIDVLTSDHKRITYSLGTPGLTDAVRAERQARVDALGAGIAELLEEQKERAEQLTKIETEIITLERQQAMSAGSAALKKHLTPENTPPVEQTQPPVTPEPPVACDVAPQGGPTGETYKPKVAGVGMEFVGLSAGQFCMGSPDGAGNEDERPQHPVKVSGFMLGKTEVTQAQWRAVVSAAKAAGDGDAKALPANPSYFKGDRRPVEQVSWCAVTRFANALSRLDGRTPAYEITGDCAVRWVEGATGYRLPTEAEWEYAARAGTTTAYATGDDEAALARAGWHAGDKTHEVCSAPEKPWGLCDLHGNVWEWTWDGLSAYAPGEASDPQVAGGASRAVRGGSWGFLAESARAATRDGHSPSTVDWAVGFRLLLPAPERP